MSGDSECPCPDCRRRVVAQVLEPHTHVEVFGVQQPIHHAQLPLARSVVGEKPGQLDVRILQTSATQRHLAQAAHLGIRVLQQWKHVLNGNRFLGQAHRQHRRPGALPGATLSRRKGSTRSSSILSALSG